VRDAKCSCNDAWTRGTAGRVDQGCPFFWFIFFGQAKKTNPPPGGIMVKRRTNVRFWMKKKDDKLKINESLAGQGETNI